jgi:hypothetical protein
MRTMLLGVVVAMAFTAGASAGASAPVGAAVAPEVAHQAVAQEAVAQVVSLPEARVMPSWIRTCGWANCSVYFNKSETRIAAYGGALLSSLICTMLRSTPAALVCTAISWAVGKAGDNAVAGGRCVKLSFSRWTGVVYYIGTYTGSQCH